MDGNFLEFIQYIEDDLFYLRVPRRILRDKQNPLDKYTNSELLNRYRFSRNTIGNLILPMVYPPNMPDTQRGLPVPPLIKLCTALRFIQRTCGDLQSISQSSVCRIVGEVSEILARNLGRYVKFPSTAEEIAVNRNLFFNIAMFPGVIGCIDGTHIEIKSPGGPTAENYRNRKGWMSLNVQVVAGPHLEILDIVIRWPGSTHDSRIFNNSALKMKFEDARLSGILLGDSAYQQTHYLYTPMQNPNTQAERRYNYAQIRTRNIVERAFGVWKGRFRCLNSAINCSLRKTLRIIAATAVLHNIAIGEKEPFLHDPNFIEHVIPNPPPLPLLARGNAVRATIIARHFTNPLNQN